MTAIKALALISQERGTDSSGIAIATPNRYSLLKNAVNSLCFLGQSDVQQMLGVYRKQPFINLIGHTRMATTGAITDDNAHPFRIGDYVFAHNGQINNFFNLQSTYGTDYEVDSQIIGYLLSNNDEETVFEKKLSGWFTVPYFKVSDPTQLTIAKYSAPLSFGVLPNFQGIFYASDREYLKEALEYAGIKAMLGTANNPKIYRFKWNGKTINISNQKLNIKSPYQYSHYPNSGYSYAPNYQANQLDRPINGKLISSSENPVHQSDKPIHSMSNDEWMESLSK